MGNNVADIVGYFKKGDMCLHSHCAALVSSWKWLDHPGQITQGSARLPRKKKKGPPQLETHGETEALNGITSLVPVTYY